MFDAALIPPLLLLMGGVWIFADIEAGGDAHGISNEVDISHLWGARERGVAIGLIALSFHLPDIAALWQWPPAPAGVWLLRVALLFVLLCVVFWIGFDLRLNLRRKKEWHYLGKSATMDGWATKLLARFRNPGAGFLLLKIILLILCIAAYFGASALRP